MAKKKRVDNFSLWKFLWFLLKIPYYIAKGIYNLIKWIYSLFEKNKVLSKRKSLIAKYEEFKVVQDIDGDYKKWIQDVCNSDSQIGIVLGSRGSGKTAFGIKLLENIHSKCKKKCYAMGFKEEEMPSWINIIFQISEIENN